MFSERRQPSCDGTSRMTRECQVRICERLGVKFPGPTRQTEKSSLRVNVFRCSPDSRRKRAVPALPTRARRRHHAACSGPRCAEMSSAPQIVWRYASRATRTRSPAAVSVAPSALLRAVRSASTSLSSAGRQNTVS